tara:strand:- start:623 stop:964 length:342 start_codon:yes stop_codon:yes gene_type:complete
VKGLPNNTDTRPINAMNRSLIIPGKKKPDADPCSVAIDSAIRVPMTPRKAFFKDSFLLVLYKTIAPTNKPVARIALFNSTKLEINTKKIGARIASKIFSLKIGKSLKSLARFL